VPALQRTREVRLLLDWAARLGIPRVATGHYARLEKDEAGRPRSCAATTPARISRIFSPACRLDQLGRAVFPVGHLRKPEVRELAKKHGLPTAETPESQDACLVAPGESYSEMLRKHFAAPARTGRNCRRNREVVGQHDGIHVFTIGQRKGLPAGAPARRWVKAISPETGQVTVTSNAAELVATEFVAKQVNWLAGDLPAQPRSHARFRFATATPASLPPIVAQPDGSSARDPEDTGQSHHPRPSGGVLRRRPDAWPGGSAEELDRVTESTVGHDAAFLGARKRNHDARHGCTLHAHHSAADGDAPAVGGIRYHRRGVDGTSVVAPVARAIRPAMAVPFPPWRFPGIAGLRRFSPLTPDPHLGVIFPAPVATNPNVHGRGALWPHLVACARRCHVDVDRLRGGQGTAHVHGRHGVRSLEVRRRRGHGPTVFHMRGLCGHGALVLEAGRRRRLHRAPRVLHLRRRSTVLHGRGFGPCRHSLVLVLIVTIARMRAAPTRLLPRLRLVLLRWLIRRLLMLRRRLMLLRLSLLRSLLLTLRLLLMLSLRLLLSLILLPLLVLALFAPQAIVVIVGERLPGSEPK
jgi:hypothetical protein